MNDVQYKLNKRCSEVNAAGRVDSVRIQQSSGYGILDEAAVRAVRRWRFNPARRGENPISSHVTVPIGFKLQG